MEYLLLYSRLHHKKKYKKHNYRTKSNAYFSDCIFKGAICLKGVFIWLSGYTGKLFKRKQILDPHWNVFYYFYFLYFS